MVSADEQDISRPSEPPETGIDANAPSPTADGDGEPVEVPSTPPDAEVAPDEAVDAGKPSVAKPSVARRQPLPKPQSAPKRSRWRRGVVIAAKVVGVVVAAALIAFVVGRWIIVNDNERIQGTWRIDGANTAITITADQIILSEDLTFDYTLDPAAKTITFHFSDLEGGGHYRFSLDGDRLAIQDGAFNGLETFASDLPASIAELAQAAIGVATPLFGDAEGVTNLTRITEQNPTGATPYGQEEPSKTADEPPAIDTLGQEPTSEAGTGAV